MITITNRKAVQEPDSITALFTGADHQADVSFFWVDAPRERDKNITGIPMPRPWVVLHGEAQIDTQDEQQRAYPGDIVTVSAQDGPPVYRRRGRQPSHDLYSPLATSH